MPAASNAPATRISSPSVTLGGGMRPRSHGVVWRHARGGHDSRADRGGGAAVGAARSARGRRRTLEGGITNRNFLVNFGGDDYVVRLPGKGTELLGIDREAERLATEQAAELGIGPEGGRHARGPPCLVTCFIEEREMTSPRSCATRTARRGGAGCERSTSPASSCRPTSRSTTSSTSTPRSRARAAASCPAFDEALERAGAIVGGGRAATRARAGPPQRPARRQLPHDGERVQIIDWEYAGMGDRSSTSATSPSTTSSTTPTATALLEAYFGEPADDRPPRALKLFRFMSDFREAMWGWSRPAVSELDFDFHEYADKHFDRLEQTGADPRFEHLARARRRERVARASRRRPLRDRRRGRRGHVDRLPPGPARLGRRGAARAQPAHLGLDLPLGRPRRPAARLGLADEDDDVLGRALPAALGESTAAGSSAAASGSPPARSAWRSCAARPAGPRRSGCRSS